MNVVKCVNGHFFDNDYYEFCPHCGAKTENAEPTSKSGKRGFKIQKEKKQTEKTDSGNRYNSLQGESTDGRLPGVHDYKWENTVSEVQPSSKVNLSKNNSLPESDRTLDFWQVAGSTVDSENDSSRRDTSQTQPQNAAPITANENDGPAQSESDWTNSLADAVKNASADTEGKTMSYFSSMIGGPSSGQNVQPSHPSDPVVGWLVCIQGRQFGESFKLGAGMNSIGRNATNRVVISDDQISREKHCLITYEPKHRNFYIKPGDSSGLTYVNNDFITENRKIFANDTIELGGSKFVFIPLCGENFTWEDYINKE